jgi:hypothetical protein
LRFDETFSLRHAELGRMFCNQIFRWWPHLHPDYSRAEFFKMEISTEDNGGEKFSLRIGMDSGNLFFASYLLTGWNETLYAAEQIARNELEMRRGDQLDVFVKLSVDTTPKIS